MKQPSLSKLRKSKPELVKILKNIGWLFFDKALRLGVGIFVSVWLARYLGPQQYGVLSYSLALVAVFDSVASLGLNGIVVRDLVRDPDQSTLTLGSALYLQMAGGVLALALSIFTVTLLRRNDQDSLTLVIILSLPLLLKSTDIIKYWFESKVLSRDIVLTLNFVFLIISSIKLWLIASNASILDFAWLTVIESSLISAALISLVFFHKGNLFAWYFGWKRAKSLLNDAWPIIISSSSTILYMKIDQIMLGNMLGDEGLGIYSAAARISEAWYAVPTAINASIRPILIRLKTTDPLQYSKQLRNCFSLMFWLSLTIAIAFQFFSAPLINLLFGPSFETSGDILSIHIWTSVFVFTNNASWNWFFAEDKLKEANKRTVVGLIINIALNYLLIPEYGVYGAAYAALTARAYVGYFGNLASKETRPLFYLISNSVLPIRIHRRI